MGYRNHPQLTRFKAQPDPPASIAAYLVELWAEARRRGYDFDASKIGLIRNLTPIPVTHGQLAFEWEHLKAKLGCRSPVWLEQFGHIGFPDAHPLFTTVPGEIESWERNPYRPTTRSE
jgi:hypothetical protein